MDVGSLIAALALGFVCGALARALVPDDAFRNLSGWRSWAASTGLGLLGALLGYWIFTGIFGIGDDDKFDWGGLVGAVIGAILVVVIASAILKRLAKAPTR
jgi:uncharacterized membrane protein YeaQ/YmgE (transglycosylase-associated protein family)